MKNPDGEVQRSELAPLSGPSATAEPLPDLNLDVLLDLSMVMSMEVGRARIPIRSLLGIVPGSILALDRKAGEPFAVFVNGKLIAQGEVVVVNEKIGVRFTDVVSSAERARAMQ
ncbi:MAG: flagellar motor switch protein FliN [Steroidobacteraceae bacterium]|jgi:flagellar motor switch protein FliN/FliY|nr:flagellar motor switch protein FliN [Steroidobacteraceae bacterium]